MNINDLFDQLLTGVPLDGKRVKADRRGRAGHAGTVATSQSAASAHIVILGEATWT